MALDPAVLAAVPEQAQAPDPPADLVAFQRQVAARQEQYQQQRLAWTEQARWASLDRVTHQAEQVLARALELLHQVEKMVGPPALAAPRPAPSPVASVAPVPLQPAPEVASAPAAPDPVLLGHPSS
jgi:hypothetical protein